MKKNLISSKLINQLNVLFFQVPTYSWKHITVYLRGFKTTIFCFYFFHISSPYYPPQFNLGFCYELKPYKIMAY